MKRPVYFAETTNRLDELGKEILPEAPEPIYALRDMWGRIRFLALEERPEADSERGHLFEKLAKRAEEALGNRSHPADAAVLFVDEIPASFEPSQQPCIVLAEGRLRLVERQLTNGSWATVQPDDSHSIHRTAFYSLKGGVGRSTTTALAAYHAASQGKSVLVLDLDLEAPGLSTSLLPTDKQPDFGIVDWLVEDAVGQGDSVLDRLTARSPLAEESPGEIWVAPSHGAEARQFIPKLGRAYLDLPADDGRRIETWEERLARMLRGLEDHRRPDMVLIDARSGFHDLASTAVTELADTVLLFAVESDQTWNGYRMLFDHWRELGVGKRIRDRLQMVAALVPAPERESYLAVFQEKSWEIFGEYLYDELEPGEIDGFSYDVNDSSAPHSPLPVYWNPGLRKMSTLTHLDDQLVKAATGDFLSGLDDLWAQSNRENHG